jgi:KUP system potassium uptake protein
MSASQDDGQPADATAHARAKAGFWTLALGSIGVVYGDIGTSPL